jgi:hypothetical protein
VKGEIRAVAKDWPATTAGRVRGLDCLARLAAEFGAQNRTGSVARMEQHIVTMLTGAKATARLAGAHLLTAWLRVVPPGPQRPALQAPGAQLGGILSNTNPAYPSAPSPDPYGEVAQMVKYVKSESMAFLRVAATNGVQVTGDVPSPEADGFGADSAATLSAAVPQVRFDFAFFRVIFSRWSLLAFTVDVIAYVDDASTLRVVLHVETRVSNTSSIGWSRTVSSSYIKVESQQVSSALALAGEK